MDLRKAVGWTLVASPFIAWSVLVIVLGGLLAFFVLAGIAVGVLGAIVAGITLIERSH